MWQIDPTPFEMQQCTVGSPVPLSYWGDYPYTIKSEYDSVSLTQIDPDALTVASWPPVRGSHLYRLDGKAIRTICEHRKELPMRLWVPNMTTLPHSGVRVSSFALDGIRLLNPHKVSCMFYLCWTEGDVRWGITPVNYDRGPHFMRLMIRLIPET